MNIAELVLPDEWAELPEDREAAFSAVVTLAQPRLRKRLQEEHEWAERSNDYTGIWDLQHGFMSSLLGVAKAYEIAAFAEQTLPLPSDWSENWHRNFQSDLNHFVAQVTTREAMRIRQSSVYLDENSKDKIRSYLNALKAEIGKSNLPERRKSNLIERLLEFEKELSGRRVNILLASLVMLDVLAAPGAVWASVDLVRELTNKTMCRLGEARSLEIEERAKTMLDAPLPLQITLAKHSAPEAPKSVPQSYDLHDDIPF